MKLRVCSGCALVAMTLGAGAAPAAAQAQAPRQRPVPIVAWSPRPVPATKWVAPNRSHWVFADILRKHAGRSRWTETVVADKDFNARFVSLAPGDRTRPQFWADSRTFWVIESGRIRFTIEGQEPFVAGKGYLVQVPYRVPYSMEVVGDVPAVRFEVVQAGAAPLYPIGETPALMPGKDYVKVSFTGQGAYDAANKPYLDFEREVVAKNGRGGAFVHDDKTFANIIRGQGAPPPPPTNYGHFHVDYSEFWIVLEGKVDYLLEGRKLFTATIGDVVYAPQGRWHRASFGGTGMATRLAINPRPEGMHNYQPPEE